MERGRILSSLDDSRKSRASYFGIVVVL